MATRSVPARYATIQAAVNAAAAGDLISIGSGYGLSELVLVGVEDLTFTAPAGLFGVVLLATGSVAEIALGGTATISILGNAANNLFTGNSGANVLTDGGGGNDSLSGGGGDDQLWVSGGIDTASGGSGFDLLVVDYSKLATAVATSTTQVSDGAANTVTFSSIERFVIYGGSNGDTLSGLTGDDILVGGAGNDILTGGTGFNALEGDAGDDTLIDNGLGSTLYGGSGLDKVVVNRASATVDVVVEFDGSSDVEFADSGATTTFVAEVELLGVTSGSGNDSVKLKGMAAAGSVVYDGGSGFDSITVDFSHATATVFGGYGGAGNVSDGTTHVGLFNYEQFTFIGGSANDVLSADAGNDTLKGNAGDDQLDGEAGNDTLFGGTGNDILYGGTGSNVLNGEAGNDLIFDAGVGSTINGSTGIDQLNLDRSAVAGAMTVNFVAGTTLTIADGGTTKATGIELLGFIGGAGGDTVSIKSMAAAGSVALDGGAGNDGVTVDFSHATAVVTGGYGGAGNVSDGTTHVGLFNLERFTFIGGSANDVLSGDADVDTLKGNAGDDQLDGEAGNDTLFGGTGNDILYGGTGSNVLNGEAGNDLIFDAGVGSTINGSTGIDQLNLDRSAVAGAMTVNFVAGTTLTIADGGTTKATGIELLGFIGGAGGDTVSIKSMAAAGSVALDGGAGNDGVTVDFSHATAVVTGGYGGAGNVSDGTTHVGLFNLERFTFIGGSANDVLSGDADVDTLKGNAGDDQLDGEAGNDTLFGGTGNDILYGGTGSNVLNGEAGNDLIFDAGVGSTINGSTGIDQLNLDRSAVAGAMTVNFVAGTTLTITDGGTTKATGIELLGFVGGAGNDTIGVKSMAAAGSVALDGGAGNDGVTVDFSHATAVVTGGYGGAGNVSDGTTHVGLFNLERFTFIGGSANDVLSGDADVDTLKGNAGDDQLDGEAGNDTLFGGTGNDILYGGTGSNVLNGEAGNDLIFDAGVGSTINGSTGIDQLNLDRSAVAGAMTVNFVAGTTLTIADGGTTKATGIELLGFIGGAGGDTVSIKSMAAAGSVALDGGAGNDGVTVDFSHATAVVTGGYGGAGNVSDGTTHVGLFNLERFTFIGGSANDVLSGDAGIDTLRGNAGDDQLDGEAGDDLLDGGAGLDTLFGGNGNDVLVGGAGGDSLDGGAGSDVASYAGASAGVTASLASAVGNTGEAAGDSYVAIEGLRGSAFADTLTGNNFSNTLAGGGGLDTLQGGSGADQFVFDQALVAGNVATIVDFLEGADVLRLSLAVFGAAGAAGTLAANAFFIGASAHDADDRVIYDAASGAMLYDADGNGAGAAKTFATVGTGLAMTASNVQLF